jgi:hypothetical protein
LENTRTVIKGEETDISHLLMFYWLGPALYLDPVSKFPETTEKPGYFVGFADNIGDVMKFGAFNDIVSTRTSSKTDVSHLDHGVAVSTRSKSQNKCNLSVMGSFFPLHDVVYFKGHEGFNDQNCN